MDNAATSYPKPDVVKNAAREALDNVGNPGRGIHQLALWSSMKIAEARSYIADLFNIKDPLRVAFTMNATHSLNIAINMCKGHVITTGMEHNSVLRPLYRRGGYTVVTPDSEGNISAERIINEINSRTGAVVMTHASNVTGQIYDIRTVGRFCRKRNIFFVVDCAQSAGIVPIDVQDMCIDCLCFTGHKALWGMQGTGGIYVAPNVNCVPYMVGGSGTQSSILKAPDSMPECFEAGTVNTHGIATLSAGVQYVLKQDVSRIYEAERSLRSYFVKRLSEIEKVKVYGPEYAQYTGVISINVEGYEPSEIGVLMEENSICCRTGYHCAPLSHKAIGTVGHGTVRYSLSHLNTKEEIDFVCTLLLKIQNRRN